MLGGSVVFHKNRRKTFENIDAAYNGVAVAVGYWQWRRWYWILQRRCTRERLKTPGDGVAFEQTEKRKREKERASADQTNAINGRKIPTIKRCAMCAKNQFHRS